MRRGRSPSCATRWHGPEPPPVSCSGCSGTALRRQRPASGLQRRTPCPPYRHDDPAESFRSLDSLLREILLGLFPETAAVVRFRADGEFLRAELPEGLGRTQALLVLQTEETVSSLLNEGRLVADAPDTLPATLAQGHRRESRCAKSPLAGPAATEWHPLSGARRPFGALAGGAAFRSARRCPLPPARPRSPRSPSPALLEELNHAARLLRPVFPPDAPFAG